MDPPMIDGVNAMMILFDQGQIDDGGRRAAMAGGGGMGEETGEGEKKILFYALLCWFDLGHRRFPVT